VYLVVGLDEAASKACPQLGAEARRDLRVRPVVVVHPAPMAAAAPHPRPSSLPLRNFFLLLLSLVSSSPESSVSFLSFFF
jgi:hypothetical protein